VNAIFDLDGTIVDTEAYAREAYVMSGVTPPDDFFGKPWHVWLPDKVGAERAAMIHDAKAQKYIDLLSHAVLHALPAAQAVRDLFNIGWEVGVITSSCQDSLGIALRAVGVADCVTFRASRVAPQLRPTMLNEVAPRGIYFDDLMSTCSLVGDKTDWLAVHASKDRVRYEDVIEQAQSWENF